MWATTTRPHLLSAGMTGTHLHTSTLSARNTRVEQAAALLLFPFRAGWEQELSRLHQPCLLSLTSSRSQWQQQVVPGVPLMPTEQT